ncbi:MAG: metallophosphoesterase, partial [Leptospirales bacterium]|nr:metallophosphoesterase [Leptospirales bacterium]
IFLAGNIYVFIRGWQALPVNNGVRAVYSSLFLFAALSFIIGQFTRRSGLFENDTILTLIGSIWLAFILYVLFIVIIIDLVRGLNFFFHFLPVKEIVETQCIASLRFPLPLMLFIGTVFVSCSIVIIGIITASNPTVNKIDIKIDKKVNNRNSINIAMASDIHLGNVVGRKKFQTLVDTINSLDPDIVLFTGDFIDRTLEPLINDDIGALVESIHSKYGIYAVTGNHEYFSGVSKTVNFMKKHKINVLLDESVEIEKSLLLVGREDKTVNRFTERNRKTLAELLHGKRIELPIIVMDHQPSSINESITNMADLHLSGHTHNGQLWPINYITNAIYEVSCGYTKIENTHIYITKGYGTWGPPVRTTGRPEIVFLKITFKEKNII